MSGFLLGLLGSIHCVGMCGPIAVALPSGAATRGGVVLERLLNNGGRILTYSLMGGALGLAGSGFAVAGLQQAISVLAGALMVLYVLLPPRMKAAILGLRVFESAGEAVRKGFAGLAGRRSFGGLFLLGVLNGLLPCGLVYAALAGAVASGSVLSGMAVMAAFGAGTFPVMFAVTLAGRGLSQAARRKLAAAVPAVLLVVGVLLILRGLNLGIPGLSPRVGAGKSHGAYLLFSVHDQDKGAV
ncbi:MAG: sulfite exporter TauE/SafE family protein [Bacteroidota bacterium]